MTGTWVDSTRRFGLARLIVVLALIPGQDGAAAAARQPLRGPAPGWRLRSWTPVNEGRPGG